MILIYPIIDTIANIDIEDFSKGTIEVLRRFQQSQYSKSLRRTAKFPAC